MKKNILVAAAVLLLSASAFGQVYVNAGVGGSFRKTVIGDDSEAKEPAAAFLGGVSYNFNLTGNLGLEVGLNYQYDAGRKDINFSSSGPTNNYRLLRRSNLYAPVELNYKFQPFKLVALKVYVGPSFFYGLTCSDATYLNGTLINPSAEDLYQKGTYNRFMFGGSAGVSAELPFGLRLKIGYMLDFTDMYASDTATMRQNLLSFSVGYHF